MGLDMYLMRRQYVRNWEGTPEKDRYKVVVTKKGKPVKTRNLTYLVEQAIYWRKANHIHSWFVENVQGGNDDCGSYHVRKEELVRLLDTCRTVIRSTTLRVGTVRNGYTIRDGEKVENLQQGKVMDDPSTAAELLPTGSGFLFGSQDYDQWYWEDTTQTIRELEKLLDEDQNNDNSYEYEYHSSW